MISAGIVDLDGQDQRLAVVVTGHKIKVFVAGTVCSVQLVLVGDGQLMMEQCSMMVGHLLTRTCDVTRADFRLDPM